MRHLFAAALLVTFAACSSSSETVSDDASSEERSAHTDACLDNPELAKTWGDCNVKHTLFLSSAELAKCRKASPKARGNVDFQLQLRPDGSVKTVKPIGGAGKHTYCVVKVMKKLKFAPPPSGKAPTITIPYQLEP